MTRACLSLLAGMYALQLSSFTAASLAGFVLLMTRQWLGLFCFCAGAVLFHNAAEQVINARIAADIAGDSIVVVVRVADFPAQNGASVSFLANPVGDERLPGRMRLSWFQAPVSVYNGDTWQLEVRLRRPRGSRNPGTFDYESWLFRERIAAVGYVVSGPRNHLLRSAEPGLTERVRRRFVSRVLALLADEEQASVLIALVVGTRHLIQAEQWERYAATGTSHLMAISGLHIGLAAGGAYLVAMLIAALFSGRNAQRNHRRTAILCSLIVALLYAELSGFAIPARRASLMLLLAGAALLHMRSPDLLAILCCAAIAIAVSDPLSTMAPGFMLSFAAVAILLWLGRRRNARLPTLQVLLLLGLLPLTAVLFGRISFAAVPVNVLAVPLFSLLSVPLALIGLLLDGPMQSVGDAALLLAAHSIALLEKGLSFFAGLPGATFVVPQLVGGAWLYLVLPLAWVFLPPGWPGRYAALLGLAGLLLYRPPGPRAGCVDVEVLDVGHGLAAVIRTEHRTLLFDTGPSFRGGGSAASSTVLPYLAYGGISELDLLLVSHADLDHAGGVTAITAALPVRQILSGEPLAGVRSVPCRTGQAWNYDDISFRILHPPLDFDAEGNNRSCVLLVEAGEYRILLSGDIERAAEQALLGADLLPAVDVVIVPHHGSRTSSTASFVQALQPSIAIVSAAFANHWGFPKPDVVSRWQAAGAEVLNTATSGAIRLQLCATSGLTSIRQYRADNRRIWHE